MESPPHNLVCSSCQTQFSTPVIRTKEDILKIPDFNLMVINANQKLKPNSLDNNDRVKISSAIIEYILIHEPNIRLKSLDFQLMAEAVVDLYPGENLSDYYENTKKKGKLYLSYHSHRAALLLNGLATSLRHQKVSATATTGSFGAMETSEQTSTTSENFEDLRAMETIEQKTENPICLFCETSMKSPEKIESKEDLMAICDFNLMMAVAKEKTGSLNNIDQCKISAAIIQYILWREPEKVISKSEYEMIAAAIVELLPSEVIRTYFFYEKLSKFYGGKLCGAYRNQRMLLMTSNLVERKKMKKEPIESTSNTSQIDQVPIEKINGPVDMLEYELEEYDFDMENPATSEIEDEEINNKGSKSFCMICHSLYNRKMPIQTKEDIMKIPNLNLMTIQAKYDLNPKSLDNKNQEQIANALVKFLIVHNPDKKFGSKTFKTLSKAIVSLFPSEKQSTYYHQGKSSISGKLYSAYVNHRAVFLSTKSATSSITVKNPKPLTTKKLATKPTIYEHSSAEEESFFPNQSFQEYGNFNNGPYNNNVKIELNENGYV